MRRDRWGLLGLARKAGSVVVGTGAVRSALQRGDLALVVMASDFGPRTDDKVGRLARAAGVPVLLGPPAAGLGGYVGRDRVQAVGIRDRQLAAGLLHQPGTTDAHA